MSKYIFGLFLLLYLVSCSQIPIQSTESTITPVPTIAATIMPSPSPVLPTRTAKPLPTPPPTPKPYLIDLYQGAGDGVDEIYICKAVYSPFPRFILYEDGQLIFYDEGKLWEVFLTSLEISDLLGKIEASGFFEIGNSFEEQYNLPNDIQYGSGGWGLGISVNGKSASVHPELTQYLKQPIKDTISIIQTYQPTGNVKPYFPDKSNYGLPHSTKDTFPHQNLQ